jgi:5-oxoprolinase (ATP-hydrolysing)/N-methylhydantoinase A
MSDHWDPIELEVLWSRLIHIADECWATIRRTAFSHVIGEALDFGVEIFDGQGRSLAHGPRSMPVFNFCLPATVAALLERFPAEKLEPGDVLITNDPWLCAGHLPDIAIVTPVFRGGEMVAIVANCANAADIGGTRDNKAARELFEEGIQIPPMKLYRAGNLVEEILTMIAVNVRVPEIVLGDIHAQISANEVGASQLLTFMDEYGLSSLSPLAAELQRRSETAMRAAIRSLPDGIYSAETIADGLETPQRLPVQVIVQGDEITVDYAGAPPQMSRGGINCTYTYTSSHTLYALKCILTPDIPANAGCFRPFTVNVPEGSILAATRPASVALRTRTGWHLHELLFKAMSRVLPWNVQAGTGIAFLLAAGGQDAEGRAFSDHLFLGGGQGASRGHDGQSTLLFPTSAGNVSIEMFEARTQLIVEYKEFIPDSGGAGEFRGGLGQRVAIRLTKSGQHVSMGAFPEGFQAAPPGLEGGSRGRAVRVIVEPGGNAPPLVLAAGALVELTEPDQRLIIEMSGGGGWGDPAQRDPNQIRQDRQEGLVTSALEGFPN